MRRYPASSNCFTLKSPYPVQIHLRNYTNQFLSHPSALPLCSYLRAQEHVVPLEMLEGNFGEQLMLKNESVDMLVSALQANQSRLDFAVSRIRTRLRIARWRQVSGV